MIDKCNKLCGNKTDFGYCRTTACINPQYSNIAYQYGNGVQKRIITNADRIRAMTDEEMAELLNRMEPKFCHAGFDYMIGCLEDKDCVVCWLDWLKQEVT